MDFGRGTAKKWGSWPLQKKQNLARMVTQANWLGEALSTPQQRKRQQQESIRSSVGFAPIHHGASAVPFMITSDHSNDDHCFVQSSAPFNIGPTVPLVTS